MLFEIPTIYFHYVNVSVLIQFLLKTSVFFISVIINLHKIIDCRCVLESSRRSDSNTRSQHMILWRNIEKKSLVSTRCNLLISFYSFFNSNINSKNKKIIYTPVHPSIYLSL